MIINDDNFDLLFVKPEKEIKQNEQIETCKIHPFKDHPYKVKDDDEMQELINSIKEHGILEPLKLLKDDNFYEVISGHRRLHAAMKLGLQTLPATVYEISRDEAAILLVDSNLHREHILPSEKAFAYKMKYEALKHQGKRSDLTSEQIAPKLTTELIAEQDGTSKDTVKRYIRLTKLIPELLEMMDKNEIAFSVGVELSYLDKSTQQSLITVMEETDHKPSYAQANKLHKNFLAGTLTNEQMEEMLSSDKPNQKPVYKISAERLAQFIKLDTPPKEAEEFIIKACDHYTKFLIRQRNRDAR